MKFGQALEALKAGKKVKRKVWGGYWFIQKMTAYRTYEVIEGFLDAKIDFETEMIVAKLKDNGGYAPAQPYQADLLAEDWEVVE